MKARIGAFFMLTAGAALLIAAGAGPAAADIEVLDANLSLSEAGGRPRKPVISIKFYENIGNWDATGLPADFNLRLYLKVNVGSYLVNSVVHLPDPSNDTNARLVNVFAGWGDARPRIVRLNSIGDSFPSFDLGAFTTQAIARCHAELPDGLNSRDIELDMPVILSVTAVPSQVSTKFRFFQFPRKIPVIVRCVGLAAGQDRKPEAPQREVQFRIINATMDVTKHNRDCPRRVAVRVTMRANMDRTVAYALHRSDGPSQRQEMAIRWQGGERYKGSFDHLFDVPKSRIVEVWVEHKGRRISGIRQIRIDCSQPWEPEGVYVE